MHLLSRPVHAVRREAVPKDPFPPDNCRIAALLRRESETATGHFALALKRASRSALIWPDEASDLVAAGRSLTDCKGLVRICPGLSSDG